MILGPIQLKFLFLLLILIKILQARSSTPTTNKSFILEQIHSSQVNTEDFSNYPTKDKNHGLSDSLRQIPLKNRFLQSKTNSNSDSQNNKDTGNLFKKFQKFVLIHPRVINS